MNYCDPLDWFHQRQKGRPFGLPCFTRRARTVAGVHAPRHAANWRPDRTITLHGYRSASRHHAVRSSAPRSQAADDRSDVEEEVEHVAVLDPVVLAFGAHLARVPGALLALAGNEVVEGNGLGADEAALEVAVDHAGGLGCGGAD